MWPTHKLFFDIRILSSPELRQAAELLNLGALQLQLLLVHEHAVEAQWHTLWHGHLGHWSAAHGFRIIHLQKKVDVKLFLWLPIGMLRTQARTQSWYGEGGKERDGSLSLRTRIAATRKYMGIVWHRQAHDPNMV